MEERAGCFAFPCTVACILSFMFRLLFLLVSLFGYDSGLYGDIFCTFLQIYYMSKALITYQQHIFYYDAFPSRKHAYIILTPLNPLLYCKTCVYMGIHYFLISAQKHRLCVLR